MAKNILVVDDDFDYLMQTQIQLQALGFNVITAEGLHAAMELLDHEKPDLAVVDLMMEEADAGFTLCYHIKKIDPAIPIIIVTCVKRTFGLNFNATTAEERNWIKADLILDKPVRIDQLQQEITRLLNNSHSLTEP